MSAGTILSNNPAGLALKTQSEANNNLYVATGNESDSLNCNCAAFLDPFPNQITWRYVDFLHSEILQYVRDIIARRSAELFQIMCFITTQKWFQFFKSQFSYVSFAVSLNMWFPIQFTRISLMIFFLQLQVGVQLAALLPRLQYSIEFMQTVSNSCRRQKAWKKTSLLEILLWKWYVLLKW